ncbi:helix-turn-helix transcriptional regulator [Microvirga sp. BT689]|uniref:helix-turn-helix domain-containing protein n=1 Tax=Microvirga arvi TaxID=2778731 RepID=UPI00194F2DAD|nr:XRE family transcriptional regulator [Microvirga arvi]MBM6583175.1 helix-turn-helix transcriptional regulator [Microvirga arvi]
MSVQKPKLNEVVRSLRHKRGWTLQQLSDRSGLPISTLSKVEKDQLTLSYDKLMDLADGFEIEVSELFSHSGSEGAPALSTGRRSITMPGEGRAFESENYVDHYLCGDLRTKEMTPAISRIKAHSIDEFGPLYRHRGEEFIYVLSGTIEVHTEFYEPFVLPQGASVYLDSTMGHGYISVGPEDAWVLAVVCKTASGRIGTWKEHIYSEEEAL